MLGHSEQWVESRILHKLFADGDELPGVYVFSKHNHEIPTELLGMLPNKEDLGIPVLAVINSPACWTLIATNMIAARYQSVSSVFGIDEIEEFSVPQKTTLPKEELHLLEVTSRDGRKYTIWSPENVFGTVYGILLMLRRMRKS